MSENFRVVSLVRDLQTLVGPYTGKLEEASFNSMQFLDILF